MNKEKTKVYIYTRVSTTMQVYGYSLEAQKTRMKGFCAYNEYEIAGEYEDAGKSGKSIVDRLAFNKMIEDIKAGKDDVRFVLVFKLSRFGRNAADVLSTLQVMQDFGVDLICVEDGIDSSKDAGKLMISVLSAVAEIERENIRAQTMEGRMQKAREGKWNGGMAPYGYKLIDGELVINEEEAEAIRKIFDVYVNTTHGPGGVAKYLVNHGIKKMPRRDWENEYFSEHTIRLIIQNPVYMGKIAFGRRKTETVVLLSKLQDAKHHIEFEVSLEELGVTSAEAKATYEKIKKWVEENYKFNVTNLYIAQIKRKHGIIEHENYNQTGSGNGKVPQCPPDKEKAIEEALKHYKMI